MHVDLALQLLGRSDQILVICSIAGQRNADRWFTVPDVRSLYGSLRIPEPANPYNALARLVTRGSLVKMGRNYAISPLGQQEVRDVLGGLPVKELQALSHPYEGSLFGNAVHTVVPPELCPAVWAVPIQRLLDAHPFETNVFLMTRFPGADHEGVSDVVAVAIPVVRESVAQHGLVLHLASDRQLVDDLLGNVAAHMWACRFGIGVFEDRQGLGLNYNVISEIGAMLMTGRRCALLKDCTAPSLPTGISGQIYKPLDLSDLGQVHEVVSRWVEDDLGLDS